jgi:hypothetical protein
MTLNIGSSHQFQISVSRYKSVYNRPIALEFFQRKLNYPSLNLVYAHNQKTLRHIYRISNINFHLGYKNMLLHVN